jgi:hypothetical protein
MERLRVVLLGLAVLAAFAVSAASAGAAPFVYATSPGAGDRVGVRRRGRR